MSQVSFLGVMQRECLRCSFDGPDGWTREIRRAGTAQELRALTQEPTRVRLVNALEESELGYDL
jgi:hypothetical protein